MDVPAPDPHDPLVVNAKEARHWSEGLYDVWWLSGNCSITQGTFAARAKRRCCGSSAPAAASLPRSV